tara:strand:+ start:28 stop:324 length:297 start_codon:yes stop_codon:yes gene_type:complete
MNTLNSKNLSKLNGKTLYQIDILNRETGHYLDPIYISAYSDDEASEKAYEFDGPMFKVKGVHTDWMDEKVLDEEKLEMANPPKTKWKWENGVGTVRIQ